MLKLNGGLLGPNHLLLIQLKFGAYNFKRKFYLKY
jgi:hypothetical protein